MDARISDVQPACCQAITGDADRGKKHVDPVCGMTVSVDDQPLTMSHGGHLYHFCSPHCLLVFEKKKDSMVPGEVLLPRRRRSRRAGILGFTGLLLVFVSVLALSNQTLAGALFEARRLGFWVLLLASGFGLQLRLFMHIRYQIRQRMAGATAEVAASGAVSTGSMIACCSHGLVNLLPIFGISAAAALLARYQMPLIIFGVFSNLIGVTIMLGLAEKHQITFSNPLLRILSGWNMELVRVLLIALGTAALAVSIMNA